MYAVIIANAPGFDAAPFAADLRRADLLVAADGGANVLRRLDMRPHMVVGDFDSLEDDTQTWLDTQPGQILRLSPRKDETDLEIALLLAVERGAQVLDLFGALGGRLDHTFANITMLTMEQLDGRRVRMVDNTQELMVSLLPLSAAVSGITIQGFYYPLTDATLYAAHARGVSNILLASEAHIATRDGWLLVIHHFDGGSYQWQQYAAADAS
jgi:thiamine pyrophosphokinase